MQNAVMDRPPTDTLSVEERRGDAWKAYAEYCAAHADEPPERQNRPNIIHYDPFDNARVLVEERRRFGLIRPETQTHIDLQRAARMTESLGAFDNTVDIKLDENGDLVSFGEKEVRTRRRAVMAAIAMRDAEPGFEFYVRRTLYEFKHKQSEGRMMRDMPVGEAMMLISPCEDSTYGRKLGMFPDRELAVLQISWKSSPDNMRLRSLSLDRANLGIVRQILAEIGVNVGADARPEDFIDYVARLNFNSQKEFDDFRESIVNRFDELLVQSGVALRGMRPKQGVVGYDARNIHSNIEQILHTEHGRLALGQQQKLDVMVGDYVEAALPLTLPLRHMIQGFVQARRRDGSSLLSENEQQELNGLLYAEKVTIQDPVQASALELVSILHDTAIEKSIRNFLAGDKQAMDWMKSSFMDQKIINIMVEASTKGVEDGQVAGGCGEQRSVGARMLALFLEILKRMKRSCPLCGSRSISPDPCAALEQCFDCGGVRMHGYVTNRGNGRKNRGLLGLLS